MTERKDVLSTTFFCLTLLAYTRFTRGKRRWPATLVSARAGMLRARVGRQAHAGDPAAAARPARLLAAAALRNPAAVVGPGVNSGGCWWKKSRSASCWPRRARVTFTAQKAHAVVALELLPPGFRLATAALGTGTYLEKTFWPVGLSVYYPYWYGVSRWWPVGWAVVLAALTAAALWQWRRRPYSGGGLGCGSWATLVPVVGLVQVGSQAVADRYMYLPHIGLFIALCWAGQEL